MCVAISEFLTTAFILEILQRLKEKRKKKNPLPGIEPGSLALYANAMPLHRREIRGYCTDWSPIVRHIHFFNLYLQIYSCEQYRFPIDFHIDPCPKVPSALWGYRLKIRLILGLQQN